MKRQHSNRLLCLNIPHIVTRHGIAVLVDQANVTELNKHSWFVRKSSAVQYVVTKISIGGVIKYVKIHRFLTKCPKNMEVHHIGGNPLDNRLEKLQVVSPKFHRMLHQHLSKFIYRQADKSSVVL